MLVALPDDLCSLVPAPNLSQASFHALVPRSKRDICQACRRERADQRPLTFRWGLRSWTLITIISEGPTRNHLSPSKPIYFDTRLHYSMRGTTACILRYVLSHSSLASPPVVAEVLDTPHQSQDSRRLHHIWNFLGLSPVRTSSTFGEVGAADRLVRHPLHSLSMGILPNSTGLGGLLFRPHIPLDT